MPTGLHFKLHYDVGKQNHKTFSGVEDLQNPQNQTIIHKEDTGDETI